MTKAMMIRTAGDPDLSQVLADAALKKELASTRAELEETRAKLHSLEDALNGGKQIQAKRDAARVREFEGKLKKMGYGVMYKLYRALAAVVVGARLVLGLFGIGAFRVYWR